MVINMLLQKRYLSTSFLLLFLAATSTHLFAVKEYPDAALQQPKSLGIGTEPDHAAKPLWKKTFLKVVLPLFLVAGVSYKLLTRETQEKPEGFLSIEELKVLFAKLSDDQKLIFQTKGYLSEVIDNMKEFFLQVKNPSDILFFDISSQELGIDIKDHDNYSLSMVTNTLTQEIQKFTNLKKLDASANSFLPDTLTTLLNAIKNPSHLLSLNISQSNLKGMEVKKLSILAHAINRFINLQELDISSNELGSDLVGLLNKIKKPEGIVSLNISGNDLKGIKPDQLAHAINRFINLQKLGISSNKLGSDLVGLLNNIKNHEGIVNLNISRNDLKDISEKELKQLALAITTCFTNLKTIDVSLNAIDRGGTFLNIIATSGIFIKL